MRYDFDDLCDSLSEAGWHLTLRYVEVVRTVGNQLVGVWRATVEQDDDRLSFDAVLPSAAVDGVFEMAVALGELRPPTQRPRPPMELQPRTLLDLHRAGEL